MASGAYSRALQNLGFFASFLALAVLVGFATLKFGVGMPLLAGAGLALVSLFLVRPVSGIVIFVALAYANVAAILNESTGQGVLIGAALTGVLCVPVFVNWFVSKRGVVLDYPFLLMIALLGSLLMSTLIARDVGVASSWITTYVLEGLLLYFLIVNAVRSFASLKAVIWTLIIVCTVLSTMTIFQETTDSYDVDFGGLAKRNLERSMGDEYDSARGLGRSRDKVVIANRAGGPMGGPNRYAQILLTILPLAMMQMWSAKRRKTQVASAIATLLILAAVFLTYSRGGFLALVALIVVMTLFRYFRVRHLVLGTLFTALMVTLLAPGYLGRVDTMLGMGRFTENTTEKKQGDGAIRGRLTEMLASLNVFFDYPLLGVGPGQYSPFYSIEYMNNPDIAFRNLNKTRRAHSLYFEMAAETGIIGLGLFLGIAYLVVRRLWRTHRRFKETRPDLAHLAMGFVLALFTYFMNAFFLHLSYQRYYWLVLAVAAAANNVLEQIEKESEESALEEGERHAAGDSPGVSTPSRARLVSSSGSRRPARTSSSS